MPYSFSFVAGSLMVSESLKCAALYAQYGDWQQVKTRLLTENDLQKSRRATIIRQVQEIRKRLENLDERELDLLRQSDVNQAAQLLFLATLRTYAFITDFMVQVIYPKLQVLDDKLLDSDYTTFVRDKELSYPELASLSATSKAKVKQVVYRILYETGILDKKTLKLSRPVLNEAVAAGISSEQIQRAFLIV